MQNYDIQCFFKIGNYQFECAFLPLGIGELAMEWRFSEQFPIGFNSSISTQSLKFIKSDRTFLLNEYLRTGEATEIYLIVRIKGNDFRMILDFAAAQWNDEYFECGAKGTPLQDVLDNISKEKKPLKFTNYEIISKKLKNSTNVEQYGFNPSDMSVLVKLDNNAGRDETLTSYSGNINELNNNEQTYGFKINMPIQPPAPFFANTNTDNNCVIPESFTSLFSFRAKNSGVAAYKRVKAKIRLYFEYIYYNSPYEILVYFNRDYAIYKNDGTVSFVNLNQQIKQLLYPYGGIEFNTNELMDITYPYGNDVTDVYFHYYLTILVRFDNVTQNAYAREICKIFTDCKIWTNLTHLERESVNVIPLKNYLDKFNTSYDIFNTNTLTNDMLKCDLTNYDFSRKSLSASSTNLVDFYVDINDLLRSLSILYGVAVVEKNGKYEFMSLNNLHSLPFRPFDKNTSINYTNSDNYDKLTIGTTRGAIKYEKNIFGDNVYTQINNKINNILEIKPNLLYSGERIFEIFLKGEQNNEVMILHSFNNQYIINNVNESPAQFINEYYSNIAVLRRLSPFLSSYFARKGSNLSGEAGNAVLTQINHNGYTVQDNGIVSFTTEALGTDYQIFEHYNANFSVPFTTETLLEYILSCKLLKINNNLYLPIKIDVNFEANTIEVECKIFKQ